MWLFIVFDSEFNSGLFLDQVSLASLMKTVYYMIHVFCLFFSIAKNHIHSVSSRVEYLRIKGRHNVYP